MSAAHEGTPVVAGVVTAVVGFSSSFVVVLAGLAAVGATRAEAASGLLALCVTQALGMLWLSVRHRTPVTLAWSTPGAALLITTGTVEGGWPAAVGAFAVTAVLIVLTGLLPWLGDLISRIPTSLARAMLAGVLLPICLEPVTGLVDSPRWSARSCSPGCSCTGSRGGGRCRSRSRWRWRWCSSTPAPTVSGGDLVPSLTWTTP